MLDFYPESSNEKHPIGLAWWSWWLTKIWCYFKYGLSAQQQPNNPCHQQPTPIAQPNHDFFDAYNLLEHFNILLSPNPPSSSASSLPTSPHISPYVHSLPSVPSLTHSLIVTPPKPTPLAQPLQQPPTLGANPWQRSRDSLPPMLPLPPDKTRDIQFLGISSSTRAHMTPSPNTTCLS